MKLFSAFQRFSVSAFFKRLFGKYEAAQSWSPDRSYIPTSKPEPRFDVTASVRTTIAAKAFHFECNNGIAQALGSTFVDYTVGANGLRLTPASSEVEWNESAKKYWNASTPFLNLHNRQPFGIDQGLIAWRWFFDGEIFIHKTRGQDASGRWQPRIELIESEYVATPPDLYREEGRSVIDGIQREQTVDQQTGAIVYGRPVQYWVRGNPDPVTGKVLYKPVPARDIIHVFEPTRPGQMRGISFLHSVLNDLHDLDDLQILEGQAAKQNAKVSRFIETATGEFDPNDEARSIPGTGATADASDGKTRMNFYRETLGAEYQALFSGDKVQQFPGERPSETSRQYWNYLTAKVCYGCGWAPVVTFSDWITSPQGTVVRGDYDRAGVFFRARSGVVQAACREVYIYVIGWGIRTDIALADPPADWTNVTMIPPRAPNVDVGRNSAAALAELSVGATNYDLIYGPLGLDAREELTKTIDFVAFIKKKCAEVAKREGVEITPGEVTMNIADALQQHRAALLAEQQAQSLEDQPSAGRTKELQTA